jgi:hypothetical protein
VPDSLLAFSAYRAALDREERAAHVYAELMTRGPWPYRPSDST